jgi:hypothetical protein
MNTYDLGRDQKTQNKNKTLKTLSVHRDDEVTQRCELYAIHTNLENLSFTKTKLIVGCGVEVVLRYGLHVLLKTTSLKRPAFLL